jgi:hypothetical protein
MRKIFKGKKAVGPIGAIMLFIVFLVMWFVWLGAFVNSIGHMVVTDNNLVGVEAFFFENLNFVIFIGMILGMLGWMYWGAEG